MATENTAFIHNQQVIVVAMINLTKFKLSLAWPDHFFLLCLPFFPTQTQKKKAVWPCETSLNYTQKV